MLNTDHGVQYTRGKIVYNLLLVMFTRLGMSFITGAARIIRVYLNGYKAIKRASTSILTYLLFSL